MRNLNAFANQCMDELSSIGVPYRQAEFVINSRAATRWGSCSLKRDGSFIIQISSVLLDENNSEYGLKQTIIHELIHTCPGCMNHGKTWKKYASMCNKIGYSISRCNNEESLGISNNSIKERKVKHLVKCKDCGHEYKHYRKCGVVERPNLYRCGVCKGNHLEVIF